MPANLTVPTIFTAVDRLSTVVSGMARNVNSFAGKASAGLARVNNKINSVIPGYNALKSALLGYVGAAVLAAAVIAGITFSVDSLVQYEKNVASLRIVLNDITQKEFKRYQDQIDAVAKSTRTSSVAVADAFAKIAELNIHLAATPQGLADVAKSAVVFARAANMEMAPAAEGLVSIMSQFGLGADQANRVINTLAAGLKHGSANIENQVEAYKNFGTVAKTANITLEQSTALVQTLAKYQLKGAEAGTALRGAIIRLQKAGAGYAHGQFNINDAIDQANKKYASLATARQKDAFLIKLFGIRQIIAGKLLLNNSAYTAELTKKVTGTNEAFVQADIRMNTVAGRLEQLKAGWVNYLTSNDSAREGMNKLKKAIVYVTDNLDIIIDRVLTFIKWFVIIKTTLWAVQKAFWLVTFATRAYAIATGISVAATEAATAATAAQTIIVGGFGSALAGVTTEIGIADAAAAGFFATLSGFVIPAALVALGGLAIWKVFKENAKTQKYGDDLIKSTKRTFSAKDTIAKISPFGNNKEESDYQAWWLRQAKTGMDVNKIGGRTEFESLFGNNYPKIELNTQPALTKPPLEIVHRPGDAVKSDSTLNVNINDPGNHVKSTSSTGPLAIPVKVGSTTGQN